MDRERELMVAAGLVNDGWSWVGPTLYWRALETAGKKVGESRVALAIKLGMGVFVEGRSLKETRGKVRVGHRNRRVYVVMPEGMYRVWEEHWKRTGVALIPQVGKEGERNLNGGRENFCVGTWGEGNTGPGVRDWKGVVAGAWMTEPSYELVGVNLWEFRMRRWWMEMWKEVLEDAEFPVDTLRRLGVVIAPNGGDKEWWATIEGRDRETGEVTMKVLRVLESKEQLRMEKRKRMHPIMKGMWWWMRDCITNEYRGVVKCPGCGGDMVRYGAEPRGIACEKCLEVDRRECVECGEMELVAEYVWRSRGRRCRGCAAIVGIETVRCTVCGETLRREEIAEEVQRGEGSRAWMCRECRAREQRVVMRVCEECGEEEDGYIDEGEEGILVGEVWEGLCSRCRVEMGKVRECEVCGWKTMGIRDVNWRGTCSMCVREVKRVRVCTECGALERGYTWKRWEYGVGARCRECRGESGVAWMQGGKREEWGQRLLGGKTVREWLRGDGVVRWWNVLLHKVEQVDVPYVGRRMVGPLSTDVVGEVVRIWRGAGRPATGFYTGRGGYPEGSTSVYTCMDVDMSLEEAVLIGAVLETGVGPWKEEGDGWMEAWMEAVERCRGEWPGEPESRGKWDVEVYPWEEAQLVRVVDRPPWRGAGERIGKMRMWNDEAGLGERVVVEGRITLLEGMNPEGRGGRWSYSVMTERGEWEVAGVGRTMVVGKAGWWWRGIAALLNGGKGCVWKEGAKGMEWVE